MGICSAHSHSGESGSIPPPTQASHRWNIMGLYDQFARSNPENLYTPLHAAAPDVEMLSNRSQVVRGHPVQVQGQSGSYVYIAPAATNPAHSVHYI